MKNCIPLSEFFKNEKELSYHTKSGIDSAEAMQIVLKTYCNIDSSVWVNANNENNAYCVIDPELCKIDNGNSLDVCISYNEGAASTYRINHWKIFEYLSTQGKIDLLKNAGLEQPNQIKKLTSAAVINWINYYINADRLYSEKNKENRQKIISFIKSLVDSEIYDKVEWYGENIGFAVPYNEVKSKGEIIRNYIKYSFSIEKQGGYISEKCEIYYECKSNIQSFLKLSDNGFAQVPTLENIEFKNSEV